MTHGPTMAARVDVEATGQKATDDAACLSGRQQNRTDTMHGGCSRRAMAMMWKGESKTRTETMDEDADEDVVASY